MGLLTSIGNKLKEVAQKGVTQKTKDIVSAYKSGGVEKVIKQEAPKFGKGAVISAGIAATTLGSAGLAGAAVGTIAKTIAATAAGGALLAPKTTKAVADAAVENPAIAKTLIASSINPALGIAAGLEGGASVIKEVVGANKETIVETLKDVGTAVGVTGLIGGAAYLGTKIYDKVTEKGETLPLNASSSTAPLPVTPQTQTIAAGTTKTTAKRRRIAKKRTAIPRISIKIDNRDNYMGGQKV